MRIDEIVRKFQEDYPELVDQMRHSQHHWTNEDNVKQDITKMGRIIERVNPYHLEGDIWTHTMMVAQETERRGLSKLLKYCALLHDIGKPACRGLNPEKKYVNFFGHEPYSAFLSIDILKHYGFSEKEIIHAFQLISIHTEPFKLNSSKLYDRMINNHKLHMDLIEVSQADSNGRFNDNPKNNADATVRPPERTRSSELPLSAPEIVVLVGLPCSGKTTVRNELQASDYYYVLSTDDILMTIAEGKDYNEKFKTFDRKAGEKIMELDFNKALKHKANIIVDRTNLSRKSRRKFLGRVPKEYRKKAIVCLTGQENLAIRNKERNETEGKFIGADVFHRMMKQFYPPLFDEFDSVEYRLT